MKRARFLLTAIGLTIVGAAACIGAPPARAQEARVEDIQISQEAGSAGTVSILVKLSQQPRSAAAVQSGGALIVEIDGVALPALVFDPAGQTLVRHVAVTPAAGADGGAKIKLEGAAFGPASTTIYRNAVLIETRLADAALPAGSSLMGAIKPSSPTPAPTLAPTALAPTPPAPTSLAPTPAVGKPAAPAKPALKAPIAATPAPDPKPAEKAPIAKNNLESHPAPTLAASSLPPAKPDATPASVKGPGIASLLKLDAKACTEAEALLAKDAWSLPALGSHALCLIDQQKWVEAKNRLDQLAAFNPEDWRVALGRAAIAEHNLDASGAEIGYRNALGLAPDEATRNAITQRIAQMSAKGDS